jgi:hypothetical protein
LVPFLPLTSSTSVMRRAASIRDTLRPCKRQSAPHVPSHIPPPPCRALSRMASERPPWASRFQANATLNQSKQRVETIHRDPAELSMQKRILNVRPWMKDYTLLHAMAFVRELERRYGRVSHIYLVKVSRFHVSRLRPS